MVTESQILVESGLDYFTGLEAEAITWRRRNLGVGANPKPQVTALRFSEGVLPDLHLRFVWDTRVSQVPTQTRSEEGCCSLPLQEFIRKWQLCTPLPREESKRQTEEFLQIIRLSPVIKSEKDRLPQPKETNKAKVIHGESRIIRLHDLLVYNPTKRYEVSESTPASGVSFSKTNRERYQEMKEYRDLRRERAMVLEMASRYERETFNREVKSRVQALTQEDVEACWERNRPLRFREYPIGDFDRWSDRWFFVGVPVPSKQFLCGWFGCGALVVVKGYCANHDQILRSGVRPPAQANNGWNDIPDSRASQQRQARVRSILLERPYDSYNRTLDRMLGDWVSSQTHYEQDPNPGWWADLIKKRKRTRRAQDNHNGHNRASDRDGRDLYGVAAPIASKKPYAYSPVDGSSHAAVIPGSASYYFSPDPFYRDQIFEFWHRRDLLSRTSLENITRVYTAEDYDKFMLEYELRRVHNAFTGDLGLKSRTRVKNVVGDWEYEDRRTAYERVMNAELDDEDTHPRDVQVPNLADISEWEQWMKRTQGLRPWCGRPFWWKHYFGPGAEIKVLQRSGWVFKDADEPTLKDAFANWQQRLRQDFVNIFGEEVLTRPAPKTPATERVLDFEMHPSSLPWVLPPVESRTYFNGPNPQRETFGDDDEKKQEMKARLEQILKERKADELPLTKEQKKAADVIRRYQNHDIAADEAAAELNKPSAGAFLTEYTRFLQSQVETVDFAWNEAQEKRIVKEPGVFAVANFSNGYAWYPIIALKDLPALDGDLQSLVEAYDLIEIAIRSRIHKILMTRIQKGRIKLGYDFLEEPVDRVLPTLDRQLQEIRETLTRVPFRVLPERADQTPAQIADSIVVILKVAEEAKKTAVLEVLAGR